MSGAHGMELPFVFDTRHVFDVAWGKIKLYNDAQVIAGQALSDSMQAYWANFARTGNPNGQDHLGSTLPLWPAYHQNKESILFDEDISVQALP